ncbi:MAG: RNA polymerase sigma factor [Planctomycetota bacterium]|jgi:RNA polymerase sigma-70 factor (ECF subfamily)
MAIINHNRIPTDGQLIAKARIDPAAFAELYQQHYESIFRYCVHRLFDKTAAEDVTSTVFLKVLENLDRFEGNDRNFRNWLYKIATNTANAYLRKSARKNRLFPRIADDNYKDKAAIDHLNNQREEELADLKKAILSLKPKYQTIVSLRYFDNMELNDIAEILDSSPATVRSQLSRALTRLRKKMGVAEDRSRSGG